MSDDTLDEYARQAHTLVDDVIENAMSKLKREHWDRARAKEAVSICFDTENTIVYEEPKFEDYEVQNISWLAIQEFTIEKAEEKIHEFIKV